VAGASGMAGASGIDGASGAAGATGPSVVPSAPVADGDYILRVTGGVAAWVIPT
jgi:hypothetical protein